jgi:peptidyl-dipeptidase Dcp
VDGKVTPIIINTCNFPKSEPALLSFDDARTLFHEFGHAMHGMLSKVRFPRLSGTNVARDFVELPSQIFEHWLEEPDVLEKFAVHVESGKPIPKSLVQKLVAARTFNQGFETVQFLGSALVDLDIHALANPGDIDIAGIEAQSMARIGMPCEVGMRHRPAHFLHIFDGDGYAAGYYSYMWAEVLDADGFRAFKEAGNAFDGPTAQRLHDYIYSTGGTRDFSEAYRLFRGKDPEIDALLEGRGLKQS